MSNRVTSRDFLFGIVSTGNVFVIAAILLERHLHSVANYLIVSLAVADLLVACLVMPLGAVYEVNTQVYNLADDIIRHQINPPPTCQFNVEELQVDDSSGGPNFRVWLVITWAGVEKRNFIITRNRVWEEVDVDKDSLLCLVAREMGILGVKRLD